MKLTTVNPFSGLEEFVTENEPLAPRTWYKIGGPAKWFIRPRSIEELQEASARAVENEVPIYVLGLGANLLVGDQGVDGAVFHFSDEHWRHVRYDRTKVEVGAGVDMQKLILSTVRHGLAGVEVLAGIPGTIGGGIRMNAGGKYGDIGAIVSKVTVMDIGGMVFDRDKDDLVFDYRSTNISAKFILGATLELDEDDPERIMKKTKEIWMFKRNTQPLNTKSCGCIFKNPRGLSAGALIDQAGLKGFRVGGAEVSDKHANFIIAHPGCRADDVMKLVKLIREKVMEKNEIWLESEVQIWPQELTTTSRGELCSKDGTMKITVLLGGPSDEREISLISGKAVADGLRAAGHEVFESDISPDDLSGLDHPADVIFPVLHGAFGESGELQDILERGSVPFVGSGSIASRLGIDKIASKRAWQSAGLLTPAWEVITRAAPLPTLPAPLVVKPIDSGSSLDVLICHTQLEVDLACDKVLERHDHAMAETLIAGPEITVGILEGEPLDPIRIITKHEFFDYEAKYKACGTEHRFDLGLPEHVGDAFREIAREANRVIGCRDLARVDLMLDKEHTPHLIEINTMPGFTPMSLLPEAAAHGGINFSALVDRLVRAAHARGVAQPEVFVSTDAQVALPRVDVRDAARLKRRPPARKTA